MTNRKRKRQRQRQRLGKEGKDFKCGLCGVIFLGEGGDVSCAFSQSSSQSWNLLEQENLRIYLQSSKNVAFRDHHDNVIKGGTCFSEENSIRNIPYLHST